MIIFFSVLSHDQGGEFENPFHKKLKKLCGVARSHTTPYCPKGNGQVERFECTLLGSYASHLRHRSHGGQITFS